MISSTAWLTDCPANAPLWVLPCETDRFSAASAGPAVALAMPASPQTEFRGRRDTSGGHTNAAAAEKRWWCHAVLFMITMIQGATRLPRTGECGHEKWASSSPCIQHPW